MVSKASSNTTDQGMIDRIRQFDWQRSIVYLGFLARLLGVYSDVKHQYDITQGLRHFHRSMGLPANYNSPASRDRCHSATDNNSDVSRRLFRGRSFKRHGVNFASAEQRLSLVAAKMKERVKTAMTSHRRHHSIHGASVAETNGIDHHRNSVGRSHHTDGGRRLSRDYLTVYSSLDNHYSPHSTYTHNALSNEALSGHELCVNCRQETASDHYREPSVWKEVAQVIDRLFFWMTFTSMALVDTWILYQLNR